MLVCVVAGWQGCQFYHRIYMFVCKKCKSCDVKFQMQFHLWRLPDHLVALNIKDGQGAGG